MQHVQVQRIEDLRVFQHDLNQLAAEVDSVTGRIAASTFEMRSLALMHVERVRSGWEGAVAALEEAQQTLDSYMCTPEDELDEGELRELQQAVRDAAEEERDAREDYNAILSCQAQLEGYCSQLYSVIGSGGAAVQSALQNAGDAIGGECVLLEDYQAL